MFTTMCFMFSDRALPWKIVDSQNPGIIKIRKNLLRSSRSNPDPAQRRASEDEIIFLTSLFIYACMYVSFSIPILEVLTYYCPFFQYSF